MKKKVFRVIIIINIMILCIIFLNTPNSYANNKFQDIFQKADEFLNMGDSENAFSQTKTKEMSDTIYNILFVIGVIVAVGVGIFIGIQFMTSGIEQKAKIKETLIAYVAGCVVIFGAFTIWKLVVNLLQAV